ncbi:MAG: arginine--tRNA ligase [Candidatus Hinthialibacter antarcticus]|nr:arginine--tRNA ligase [Candidatus Hinthialibacter antarcticus]
MYYDVVKRLNAVLAETANQLAQGSAIELPALEFFPTKDLTHGDLSTNAAMILAKPFKKSPCELAQQFVDALNQVDFVETAAIAGPGFINVTMANSILIEMLNSIIHNGGDYGRSNRYANKTALVEFVSANPTGPLHVGHVRGAIVGDGAAELLKAVGYGVTREYYYNDAGVQMEMLGRSVQTRYLQLHEREAELPENGYKGDYIRIIAAALKTARGDELLDCDDWRPFTEFAADVLMSIIMDDLRRLRVNFDTTFSERTLHDSGAVQKTLDDLAAKGATYEKENAVWLKTTDHGDDKDRVLVKSDGEPTYVTPDIAYHCEKYSRGFDRLVNVMGHDHHSQVERVKIALGVFDYDISNLIYLLNQMVSIQRSGEKIKLSTREGQFMTLADMVEELGADVTRYFFAQRSYSSQMVFDWDLAKQQSMENPVYYLQYVHARACSMQEKTEEKGVPFSLGEYNPEILSAERERQLLLKLFYYPQVVMDAAEKLELHQIPAYLEDLAKAFHGYYQVQRVLDAADPEGSAARLHLVLAVRQVMSNGLSILKVEAPERM